MPHQLYAGGLKARDIYPGLKKYFYKEVSDINNEEFLSTKLGLWIDTRSSIDNTLHGNGRVVDKGIILQIEKAAESSGDLRCYIFSLEDAAAHLNINDPNGILTIEKWRHQNNKDFIKNDAGILSTDRRAAAAHPLEWICITL